MENVESLFGKACLEMPTCRLSAEGVLSRIKARLQTERKLSRALPKFLIPAGSAVIIAGVVVGSLYGTGFFKTETPMKVASEYGLGKKVSNGTDSFTLKDSWLGEEALSLEAEVNLSKNGSVFYASSFTVTLGSDGTEISLPIDFSSFVANYGANGWSKDGDGYSFTVSEENHFVGTFDFSFTIDRSSNIYSRETIPAKT